MSLLKTINTQSIAETPTVAPVQQESQSQSSLLKELSNTQQLLKKSDATDAGTNDVADKAGASTDIAFSLMRNTINSNGVVSGSDVANYIERAEELNDEIDTVPFGLETDDGQIVKVYVNAEQADKFEEAMKNMLGLEDDIEEAINRLTTEFDIVDVVWPRSEDEEGDADPDADLELDDTEDLEIGDDFADDNFDVVASDDSEEEEAPKKKADPQAEVEDEIAAAAAEDEAGDEEASDEGSSEEDETDEDGKPKKKKKKKAAPAEPVEDEDEPVKEALNAKGKTPWAQLNYIAKEHHGEFGFSGLDEDDMEDYIDIKRANKMAEDEYGEFGFASLDEDDMADLINQNPDLLTDRAKKRMNEAKGTYRVKADETKGRIYYEGSYDNCEQWIEEMGDQAKYKDLTFDIVPTSRTNEAKEQEADSPSQAAAIKAMTGKGLHIAAMVEGPNNVVYIEDNEGEEYVMRGDKKLTKEKHGKKLTRLKKEDIEQENNMTTIGSKFLARVLQEAPGEDRDGVKDGFNIPLDSQARALTAKLKLPFAKRLIAFHVMAGVPGRYLNTEDVESTISSAADMLRKKVSVRRAFMSLYEGLANAKGYAPPAEQTNEAKDADGNQEYTSFAAWKRALKKAHPGHWLDGDEDIANALVGDKPFKRGSTKGVGEWDGSTGWIKTAKVSEAKLTEAPRQKRGSFIQKLFETVLVELGLPESLITTGGPSAVGTGVYRTAELIEQDSNLERALRLLATRLGVKSSDAMKPVSEGKKLSGLKENREGPGYYIVTYDGDYYDGPFDTKQDAQDEIDGEGLDDHKVVKLNKAPPLKEALDVGNDDFAQAVVGLVSALGIPDDVLQRRRTQIVQSLRTRKAELRNRAQVLTLIGRLQDVLSKNTAPRGGQPEQANEDLNEAKVDVEAVLSKIQQSTNGSARAVRALFLGGSAAGMDTYLAKLEKDGYDSGGDWEENKAWFKKHRVTKSEYNALVKASL
jgi:hypothetical protein